MAAASFLPLHLPASPRPATVATRAASGLASTVPQTSQLEESFGRKGLKFGTDATGAPTAELSVRNGSTLQLRLNDGLVTSYRPKVYWKDEFSYREVLHTVAGAGAGTVRGGVGLVLNDASSSSSGASLLAGSEWAVTDADSDSYDAVQVELGCGAKGGALEVSYVVTLYALSMATAVIVKNNGSKPVELTSAVLSHIRFDKRRGTAVEGLRGCPYCTHPPPASGFALLTPAEAMKREEPGWFGGGEEPRQGAWTVEENLYTILKKKVSRVYAAPPEERKKRIYSTAPSKFTTIDQEMETKQVAWTPTMSAFMLANLCDVVAKGTRTSTGFKKCHYVACAKALNDHFHLNLTEKQISNHNRTWRRKYQKIVKLKQLSGAGWDEEKFIIVLDHEHYTSHIMDHKEDEPFLNKPIEHYGEMATIHGGSMATGQFARGSSEPLASHNVIHLDEEVAATVEEISQSHNVGESSAPKHKKAKANPSTDEGLQATLLACSERLAVAIEKTATTDNYSPLDIWENMKTLPGFGLDFLAHYYAYLVENPRTATAFQVLENDQKMVWVARYVKNTFPEFVPNVDSSNGEAEG